MIVPVSTAAAPALSWSDIDFILINQLLVLSVTLVFFTAVLLLRRLRGQTITSRITGPIKLSLLGILLVYGERALLGIPAAYRGLWEGLQTIVIILCLARLVTYLIVDVYLRLHTKQEVPSFLRDAVLLVVSLVAAITSLRLVFKIDLSAIVATTTVITAAIAFAMQNTLSNALSGLSIQTDNLLARQNWIAIKEKNIFGEIVNVGFRYTTLRNPDNILFMVPNSVIMQSVVTFYGNREIDDKPALFITVMLGYDLPPVRAKDLLSRVLADEPEVLKAPAPSVDLVNLGDNGITYRLKFFIADPSREIPVQDVVYTKVWYAVNREGYSFPFPHREIINAEARPPFTFSRDRVAVDLQASELFFLLDDAGIGELAAQASIRIFGPGETVIRQGESGSSLFIVLKGHVRVFVNGKEVGAIPEDSFFGEMSLLTGEPRTATVRASGEVWLAEVTKELLSPFLQANPEIMDKLSTILTERERRNSELTEEAGDDVAQFTSLKELYLQRLKNFFKL